jgi:hypothetical protein
MSGLAAYPVVPGWPICGVMAPRIRRVETGARLNALAVAFPLHSGGLTSNDSPLHHAVAAPSV